MVGGRYRSLWGPGRGEDGHPLSIIIFNLLLLLSPSYLTEMASHTNEDMKINPQRAAQLIENLKTITGSIKEANSNGRKVGNPPIIYGYFVQVAVKLLSGSIFLNHTTLTQA